MDNELTETIEIQLFLEAMKRHCGYDFSQYRPASIRRRIKDLAHKNSLTYISELIPYLLYQRGFLEEVIAHISIGVSAFFRDPEIYRQLNVQVLTQIAWCPHIRVWSAGCATGEEAYSLAILFKEAGLLDKTQIIATDICQQSIDYAQTGIYPDTHIRQYSTNYQQAGGITSFSNYFTARYNKIKIVEAIINTVTFRQHNLAMDHAYEHIQLIVCRNVLIYFTEALQLQVLKLFSDSLQQHGFLLLGPQDCLYLPVLKTAFEVIDEKARLYRKK